MDILELRMNYSAFIKLRNFVKINDISAEIKEYVKREDVVNGKLDVCGNYLEDDLMTTCNFNEEIPFSIIFANTSFDVVDIDCVNLDYEIVDGRGIDVMFDVLIKYEEYIEDDVSKLEKKEQDTVIEIPVVIEEDNDYEKIKEEKEAYIDKKIEENLEICEDNNPTEEKILIKEDKKRVIKVCYYQDNKELDDLCVNNNIGIDKIFNDNKNTDFIKHKRVIIK